MARSATSTLAVVAAAMFMGTFSGTVVTIVLPVIAADFHVPTNGTVEWVVVGYLLGLAALQLTGGRLADMLGRKPVWLAGLAIFTLGAALCGVAPSLPWLVAARIFQAVGSSCILALAAATLADAFPPSELGRAMAWNSVVIGVGIGFGPTLGGLIAQHLGWRWIFLINVPIGLAATAVSARVLPAQGARSPGKLDVWGTLLLALGLAALTLGLSFGNEWGWTSLRLMASVAVAAVALILVLPVERRAQQPAIDTKLFQHPIFTSAFLSYLFSFVSFFSVVLLMPFYLVQLRGFDIQTAGLLLTPFSALMMFFAPLASRLSRRLPPTVVSALGMACGAAGLGAMALFDSATPVFAILAAMFVIGAGEGLFYPPNNEAYFASAPLNRRGLASGLLATGRAIGQTTGVALSAAIFIGLGGSAAASRLAQPGLSGSQL
ncbi:MAG: MFS transporter, partial [Chloroflexota bacterium]|nr:MFS transporter [Chloroflexota bacterium]